MFKAIDCRTGAPIISIDAQWTHAVADLRALDRQNLLVCPCCHEPVRVRAGTKRHWHFAHKHAHPCTYGQETAILLEMRAALYHWLQKKWGPGATLEYQPQDAVLPRPIDCWVASDDGYIAYWIVEATLPPQKREALKQSLEELDATTVHWIFIADMLHPTDQEAERVTLTKTERD